MRTRAKIAAGVGLALALCIALLFQFGSGSTRVKIERMLAHARLAPLPSSTTNLAYYQWNRFFTGETLARFELASQDLQAFLTNSPVLQEVPAKDTETFNANRQHLPYRHPKFPDWFDPSIRGNGRMYFIWPDKWIYLDEDKSTVWLRFVKG